MESADRSGSTSISPGKTFETPGDPEFIESDCNNVLTPQPRSKIAPRSGHQFKVGPAFGPTSTLKPILLGTSRRPVPPCVTARIDRGFDLIDDEWIGYKRNYFTLVAAFEFENQELDILARERFSTLDECRNFIGIHYFAIKLTSRCCEEETVIGLVQHTAKRDRGPQNPPPVFNAIPGILPSHQVIKQSANIRNEDKICSFNRVFYSDVTKIKCSASSILKTYPTETPAASVSRYERIQFSSAINNKKPTTAHRHFVLRVELLGALENGKTVELAYTETPPLTIRGRSPSNYPKPRAPAKHNTPSASKTHKKSQTVMPQITQVPHLALSTTSTNGEMDIFCTSNQSESRDTLLEPAYLFGESPEHSNEVVDLQSDFFSFTADFSKLPRLKNIFENVNKNQENEVNADSTTIEPALLSKKSRKKTHKRRSKNKPKQSNLVLDDEESFLEFQRELKLLSGQVVPSNNVEML